MEILYSDKAARQLRDFPRQIQKRIVDKMRFYAAQENPLRFADHLTDYREGEFRFRIGNYRVIFDASDKTIYVLKVKKRDKAYD